MILIAYVPFFVCILGIAVYMAAKRGELKEMGRLCFAIGLLVVLWHMAGAVLKIG